MSFCETRHWRLEVATAGIKLIACVLNYFDRIVRLVLPRLSRRSNELLVLNTARAVSPRACLVDADAAQASAAQRAGEALRRRFSASAALLQLRSDRESVSCPPLMPVQVQRPPPRVRRDEGLVRLRSLCSVPRSFVRLTCLLRRLCASLCPAQSARYFLVAQQGARA
jgi:hypothetical protein